MRPGQTAPECVRRDMRGHGTLPGFNEAGADCPGMQFDRLIAAARASFASMRPGQTAPECHEARIRLGVSRACFNEAGADCPGMRSVR